MKNLIKEIMDENSETIKQKVKEDLKQKVITTLSYSLQSKISEAVSDFISEEFSDDIKEFLSESKPEILKGLKDGFITIGAKLAEALTSKAVENLEIGSYRSQEIIKKIFN